MGVADNRDANTFMWRSQRVANNTGIYDANERGKYSESALLISSIAKKIICVANNEHY